MEDSFKRACMREERVPEDLQEACEVLIYFGKIKKGKCRNF